MTRGSPADRLAVENLMPREIADAIWLASRSFVAARSTAASPEIEVPVGSAIDDVLPASAGEPASTPADVKDEDQLVTVSELEFGFEQTPPRPTSAGTPVMPVRVTLDRGLPAGLRALKQTLPSPREQILDAEATAKHALVDARWIPVFTPAEELRWDVVLVVDDGPSMALWEFVTRAFADLLVRQGAFQNVQIRLLHLDETHGCSVRGAAPGAPPHDISEILAPTGRRIVLVLTDGASDGWRSGAAQAVLLRWACTLPVAIVHLLPWRMWRNTGLRMHRLAFQASAPGLANRRLSWRPQTPAANPLYERLGDLTPVPVLGLNARWFGPWAQLVAGTSTRWTNLPTILLDPVYDRVSTATIRAEPAQRVANLRATVGPVTFELATCLAAAPLDLNVMSTVQRTLLPTSQLAHLSEFLACGPVDTIEPLQQGNMRVVYEFAPGLREELLAAGRQSITAHVLRVVEQCLPEARGFSLSAHEESDDAGDPASELSEPLRGIRTTALAAMSGKHLALSRRLLAQSPDHNLVSTPPPVGSRPRNGQRPSLVYGPAATGGPPSGPFARVPRSAEGTGDADLTTVNDSGLEDQRAKTRTSPTVWGGVPPRNPNFTGREDLLRQLHERLMEPGAMTAVLPQTLHGLGGVGKSQLAVEYAYRHRADFDVIWWIPAELTVQIQSSLAELGQRLNLGAPSEVNVAVNAVLDALKGSGRGGLQLPPNWLLIYDNADDPENIVPYLPTGGPGRILVTSRNSQWLNRARPLEVDVFQRAESIMLLQRRGPDLNNEDADRLAAALGDLPLAIEQAAAWRAETGMPAGEYIQLLEEKQHEMLDLPGPLDYQKSVAAAWNLSLDNLRANNPAALRVLQICAFFAPEPVPRSMFANARSVSVEPDLDRALHDRLRLSEVIRDINRYALARIDHRINSIQMHRLVQAVLISQMTEEERDTMRHGAHLLLAANDPLTPDSAEHWARYSQLYPHVVASKAIECEDSAVRELVYNMAQFLHFWGESKSSRVMSQQIYDGWRARFGAENPETLKIGRWLGFMLWTAGEFRRSAEFNAELLDIHQRVIGEEHEDTLDAMGSVAGDRRADGDFAGALEFSRTIHQRCVQRFGDNDPLTLNAAHNLAVSLRLSGLFVEARERDEITWQRKVDTYGTDHALSLLTQVGLTLDQRELGDYVAASTVHDEIVARYQAVHGPLNPATLRAVLHQAGMKRKAGDHKAATDAADEAFEGLFSQYGQDHPDTIAAQLSRSINLRLTDDLEASCRLGEDVLDRYRTVLGDGHPHTLAAGTELAVTLRQRGKLDRARVLNQAALVGFRRLLGDTHPSTIIALMNIASDIFALGQYQDAYEMDVATTAEATRALGADHPITLAVMANKAQDLRALGRDGEGKALQAEVHVGAVAKLGQDKPAVRAFTKPDLRVSCDIDPMPL